MILAVVLALVGLLIGPGLGVVVDRAVERERLAPTHRCPVCDSDLGPRSMVPVASWFQRCPADAGHARWRYPVVDVGSAALFAVAGARFGLMWQLWPYLAFFAVAVVMAVIDWEHHLLLDILTIPTLLAGVFAVLVLGGLNDFDEGTWPALAGAGCYGLILLVAHLANPAGLGLGDVKLAPTLGLFVGWLTTDVMESIVLVVYAMVLGMLSSAVVGLILRYRSRSLTDEQRAALPEDWIPGEVPLGPFIIMGAVVIIAATPPAAVALAGG